MNHVILLNKLRQWNLPPNLLLWIESYLCDRGQFVLYGNSRSYEFKSTSGVPQGSHIDQTLFLIFVDDVVEKLGDNVFVSLYANDLKIAKIIKSIEDSNTLQNSINNLRAWCEDNSLHLNLDKCNIMTISKKISNIIIDYKYGTHIFNRVYEHKDLGVMVDNRL